MKQRYSEAEPISRDKAQPVADMRPVVEDVAVTEHHAFWKAGRPRGILHVDDVVHVEAALTLRERFQGNSFRRGQDTWIRHRSRGRLFPQIDDPCKIRQSLRLPPARPGSGQLGHDRLNVRHVVDIPEARRHNQSARSRLTEEIFDFLSSQGRVYRHKNGADLCEGKLENDPLRNVGGPNGHAVSFVDSECQQSPGQPDRFLLQIQEGPPEVASRMHQGFVISKPGGKIC